ncbi:MAG: hypothetical protein QOI77_2518 [Blastocatellia bacterium]|jgi:hypothetical protein|nr:hypothetical protein [Blastocatellia bacterium]
MHKNCPHCNEETLGWRELILLDSFSPVQCENCHELLLGSGWRRLLGVLIFLTILAATMPLWQYIPGEGSVFLIPFAVIVFASAMVLTAKPVKAEVQQTDPSPFTPDPNNDKTILIQGWSEAELRQILDDFVEEDLTVFAAFRIEIEKHLENASVLIFPEDIHPAELVSLVNYLAYPINFVLNEREIVVAGKTTLNSDFDGLAKSLEGKKAILYLPQNDEDHDVVYLRTESGMTLAKSLNEGVWRRVNDSRLPSAVESLTW